MRYEWIARNGCRRLILFFNGWGMDSSAVASLEAGSADVLMLYAYHMEDGGFDFSFLSRYERTDVVAWSMGVWYVSAFGLHGFPPVDRSVALCGTPEGVDDTCGIQANVFSATLSSLSPRSLEKFAVRMCGGRAAYDAGPLKNAHGRGFEDSAAELAWWDRNVSLRPSGNIHWDVALVSKDDMIFPQANQLASWGVHGTRTVAMDIPHFPFGCFGSWDDILGI